MLHLGIHFWGNVEMAKIMRSPTKIERTPQTLREISVGKQEFGDMVSGSLN